MVACFLLLFSNRALVRPLFVRVYTAWALCPFNVGCLALLRYGFVDSYMSPSSPCQYVHLLLPPDFVFACSSASFGHYPVTPA